MLESALEGRNCFCQSHRFGIRQVTFSGQAYILIRITKLNDFHSKSTCKFVIFQKKRINKTEWQLSQTSVKIGFQHPFGISLLQDQVRLVVIIFRTLHASYKQSALHKLIKFNHTTLERKTARHMLFHLIAPFPYIIRNLPQLLQPTDFCV